jgi:uncharacterized protein YukE
MDVSKVKYAELFKKIEQNEKEYWFAEFVYFKALEQLEDVRRDVSELRLKEHVIDVIRIFLVQWGQMARAIEREKPPTDWDKLTKNIKSQRDAFQRLAGKDLLSIDFDEVAGDIECIYNKLAEVRNIGATATSKILHLLNPEVFVMWDGKIIEKYKEKYEKVGGNAKGYVEFLKAVQREVKEAIEEEAKRSGKSEKQIVEEICTNLPSKKLGPEYSRKSLTKLVDEYNWTLAHRNNKNFQNEKHKV